MTKRQMAGVHGIFHLHTLLLYTLVANGGYFSGKLVCSCQHNKGGFHSYERYLLLRTVTKLKRMQV
jgi:hypothetical protein